MTSSLHPIDSGFIGAPISSTSYPANAVDFDGSTTYLSRGADLTGLADGKAGTVSFWFRIDGGNGATQFIMGFNNSNGIIVFRRSANDFIISGRNSAATNILLLLSASTYTSGSTWHHFLASWNLASGLGHLYIDDAADLASSPTLTNDTIDYTRGGWFFGAGDGFNFFNGCLADSWFDPSYLDITVTANRRKFISALKKPVFLGYQGERPTGTQPVMFFAGPTSAWHTNRGSGGGFTENGALTDASSQP